MGELQIERRTVQLQELRLMEADGQAPRILGHAAVFNSLSEEIWGFHERIEPGFFRDVLGNDVRALWNHNDDMVLGRSKSGTLRIQEDDRGLAVEIEPPDTSWARDAMVTMGRGDVDQMSFAFQVRSEGERWSQEGNGLLVRTLLPGGCERLYDVSPVTFPAYPETSVAVRAQARAMNSQDTSGDGQGPNPDRAAPGLQGRLDVLRKRLDLAEI